MTMQTLSRPWPPRLVRFLGVERSACQKRVNDLRAQVGISPAEVERALVQNRALRTALATGLPLPGGPVWTAIGFIRDVQRVATEHAMSSACVAYLRDPEFFDRPGWPGELVTAMTPLPHDDDRLANASLVAGILAAATARTQVRRLVRGRRGVLGALAMRAGAAMAWGHIEARLGTHPAGRHANDKMRRGETPHDAFRPRVADDAFSQPIGEVLPFPG